MDFQQKKKTKVTLKWAEKFKELLDDENNTQDVVIHKFAQYCDEQENKINKSYNEQEMKK